MLLPDLTGAVLIGQVLYNEINFENCIQLAQRFLSYSFSFLEKLRYNLAFWQFS